MKKIVLLIGVAGIAVYAIIHFSVQSTLVLEVRNVRDDRSVVRLLLQFPAEFRIQSVHSVHLTPYTHTYRVNSDGDIVLTGAIFESEGVGLPGYGDGKFSFADGKFRMDEMDRFLGVLRFRISPVSEETLVVSNAKIPLYTMFPEGTSMEIKAVRTWMIFKEGNSA